MPKTKVEKNRRHFKMDEQHGTPDTILNPAATTFHMQSPILQHIPTLNLPNRNTNASTITPELNALIHDIVNHALNKEKKTYEDEQILDRSNISDLDKVPDIVKVLREFSGNPAEYLAWRKSVDRIMEIYGNLRGTAKFYGIISVIRTKITGQADIKLEAHNTPLNWDAIKECLNTHYADKRDIGTLEYQLNTLIQGNNTIEQFYQRVYTQFSLILNKLSSSGMDKVTEIAFTDSYRKKALDTFIRGLNGDLPRLLAVHEPCDLPQALYMCTKLANQNYRTQFANQKALNTPSQIQYRQQPQIPRNNYQPSNPRRMNQQFHQQHQPSNLPRINQQSYQQLYPHPIYFNGNHQATQNNSSKNINQQYKNQNIHNANQYLPNFHEFIPPPRPLAPKPQPAPEPMDIDHSIRSQAVNYSNIPRQNARFDDRGTNNATYNQPKQQQNFHIVNTFTHNNTNNYEEGAEHLEEYEEETITEYVERYDEQSGYNQQFES